MRVLRFIFDHHINARALTALRDEGVDLVHAAEVGLAAADDADLLAWAVRHDRIVVTRNYRDFAPLVGVYARRGVAFPGVLFYASSIRQSDTGSHVRAVREWIREATATDANPVEGGLGWLR
jgi:predicted nuclease of predicted toxin-antitoxin system